MSSGELGGVSFYLYFFVILSLAFCLLTKHLEALSEIFSYNVLAHQQFIFSALWREECLLHVHTLSRIANKIDLNLIIFQPLLIKVLCANIKTAIKLIRGLDNNWLLRGEFQQR